ncbi:hypothetical protein ACFWUZ_19320 [Streptomyces sp. NPDC058646]|uniref:hypothetical protein n=1 Tax=Streptomyces sp. NPDC058646 TaxID=3346574 RepID=UPI003661B3B1
MAAPQDWHITSGSPGPEEVAAVTVALSAVLAARAAQVVEAAAGAEHRPPARWSPATARRRAVTSWTAGSYLGWRRTA